MYNFSFLLPTRKKVPLVHRLFDSIIKTTSNIDKLEIILGIDEDDNESKNIQNNKLNIKKIFFPKNKNYTLSALFEECFKASNGRFVQMMNDDVVLKTKNWDNIILNIAKHYKDDICLFHVNDLLRGQLLACHPIVSRRACREIGFTDTDYKRYNPDDHIYDIYNILAYLGFKRIFYLENVIFHHLHDTINHKGKLTSITFNTKAHNIDNTLFFSQKKQEYRKQLALKLLALISNKLYHKNKNIYNQILKTVKPYTRTKTLFHTLNNKISLKQELAILFITQNISSNKTKNSIKHIKQFSHNYKLIIIEKNENYIKNINSYIPNINEQFIAIIHDNINVQKNWFENIKQNFDSYTALVAPLYRSNGKIYSSFFFLGNNFLDYSYIKYNNNIQTEKIALRSSILILDNYKLKNIKLNELFMQHYIGPDLSLKVWKLGYKVKECHNCIVNYTNKMNYPYNSNGSIEQRDKAACLAANQTNIKYIKHMQKNYSYYKNIELLFKPKNLYSISQKDLNNNINNTKHIFNTPTLNNIKSQIYKEILTFLKTTKNKNNSFYTLKKYIIANTNTFDKIIFSIKLPILRQITKYTKNNLIYKILTNIYNKLIPNKIKNSQLMNKIIRKTIYPIANKIGIVD